MKRTMPSQPHDSSATFEPLPADANGSVSWIHLGDLHMKAAGEQNDLDLGQIVDAINSVFAKGGVSFVYLPGDIADDGSTRAYSIVRSHLDRLTIPWFGIVGDHDVHEKSFQNFQTYIAPQLTSSFTVGQYRFLRLNAFAEPRPDAFIVDTDQLAWIEEELRSAVEQQQRAVLFLHCYPSDLKQGGDELSALLKKYPVLLVDMGHTHYNEISNDGRTLYSATRSTGQIEEGPVGFSVVTVDGNAVSWHFVQPGTPELVAITAPPDRRVETELNQANTPESALTVRAKVWSGEGVQRVSASVRGAQFDLKHDAGVVWTGSSNDALPDGQHKVAVKATTINNHSFESHNEFTVGPRKERTHADTDQENAVGEWSERGILGTQLGPNKNGRKW